MRIIDQDIKRVLDTRKTVSALINNARYNFDNPRDLADVLTYAGYDVKYAGENYPLIFKVDADSPILLIVDIDHNDDELFCTLSSIQSSIAEIVSCTKTTILDKNKLISGVATCNIEGYSFYIVVPQSAVKKLVSYRVDNKISVESDDYILNIPVMLFNVVLD